MAAAMRPGRAMRLRGAGILSRHALGEFSLRPQQGEVRTLIVRVSSCSASSTWPAA